VSIRLGAEALREAVEMLPEAERRVPILASPALAVEYLATVLC
jgi:hypothetical protein